jgi:uncharacterized protein YPO0396
MMPPRTSALMRDATMTEPAKARTIHLGQFRLIRLQIVNWGTFCGYKDLPIDERGVLFTGPSASGKSSLLDGHSVVLLPTLHQQFNASADLTARGARQATRNAADYVRGAWSENDDEHGQGQVRYLRGGKPTWSAIGATYDDGLGSVTTGVVIKWFASTETDGAHLRTMHQLHEGHFDLTALNEWAQRGFDQRWLKNAYPPPLTAYPATETEYMRSLAKRVGLGTSKTALSLLGKAKAMKNVGDLNLFIRENMLDRPGTFDAAATMIGLFEPLNEAFETARRAFEQQQVLVPVPDAWAAYSAARHDSAAAESVQGAAADRYLRGVHLALLSAEIARLKEEIASGRQQLADQDRQAKAAKAVFRSLDDQLRAEGSDLASLESELERMTSRHATQFGAHRIFSGHLARMDMDAPQDRDAFASLQDRLPSILEEATQRQQGLQPRRREAARQAGEAAARHRERAAELAAVQASGSLLPARAIERRDAIARGAGVPAADLAYAAELIDLADGEERWRAAAEKVVRSYGMRLLVPGRHKDAVRAFIDEHDMRGIVDYSIVTAISAHQPRPATGTLASKLEVDTGHPSGFWLSAQITRQFEHVCVETARDLEPHQVAVTVRGTVKHRGNHYRKDDRPEVTSPSSYILGGNAAAKRAALEKEVAALATARNLAETESDQMDSELDNVTAVVSAATQLTLYSSWDELDHWTSARAADNLRDRIAQLKAANVNLQRLQEQRDDAEQAWEQLVGACGKAKDAIQGLTDRKEDLADRAAEEAGKSATVTDSEREYLDKVYARLRPPASADGIAGFRQDFHAQLERCRRDADQEQRVAAAEIQAAISVFTSRWPDASPDGSGDVDRCGADYAALHEEITRRRLPEAMHRFQTMISEDMVPSISVLYRTIETAGSEIRRRVDMVNAGLTHVEFNQGTHLQIAVNAHKFESIRQFRGTVDDLLKNAPAARATPRLALAQFTRVRDLMVRFTSDDPEDKRWRETVLDVRLAFSFYGREENCEGVTVHTYRNTAAGSGGEQEKLVAFCLAAALSYNLADDTSGGRPRFAPLMLDEAFSKSDEMFAGQALAAFDEFGFQLITAAPIRMSGVLEPFIGQAVLVEKRLTPDGAHSNAASATFGDLAIRRAADTEGTHAAA